MRLIKPALVALIALAIVGCSQSSNTSQSTTDQATAAASGAPAGEATAGTNEASPGAEASAAASPGEEASPGAEASSAASESMPVYPGATQEAAGSTSNMMGGSAAGKVLSTTDPFAKVYAWYQKNMPAGSEKSHVTAPVESAIFLVGAAGTEQQSVTISAVGGKTTITIAKVKKQ